MLLTTTVAASDPSTGPRVQKPMAVARPTCGLKSRTSAGVATRTTPSNAPRTAYQAATLAEVCALPRPKMQTSAQPSVPQTITLARPYLSVTPAASEATALATTETTLTPTKKTNDIPVSRSSAVLTLMT